MLISVIVVGNFVLKANEIEWPEGAQYFFLDHVFYCFALFTKIVT